MAKQVAFVKRPGYGVVSKPRPDAVEADAIDTDAGEVTKPSLPIDGPMRDRRKPRSE